MKDGLGSRENQALRTVRAKRDAEEAGRCLLFMPCVRNYHHSFVRQGISQRCPLVRNLATSSHENPGEWLQGICGIYALNMSLSLDQSLEMFVEESAESMKNVLTKYTDNMV